MRGRDGVLSPFLGASRVANRLCRPDGRLTGLANQLKNHLAFDKKCADVLCLVRPHQEL